jgi:HlyD family secretion protein
MKKLIAAVVILLIIGAGITYYYMGRDTAEKFRTTPITRGSLRAAVTATGTVNAVTTVLVGTQVSGTVKKLHVDYNSHVKKGQVIAEIDPATLQAQVDQAKANVLAARANVMKMKAVLTDSTRIRDRNRQLFSRNLIARSDLETSEANNDSNDAQLSASEAQVKQTEAALRFAETNLGYTKIISPVDGIVVSRNVDVGQTVAASFQTPTLFTIAQDLTKMQIDTNVDEADIGKVRTGQGVDFSVDAYPDYTFNGRVAQIRISPVTVQNVVTYDVVIKVDNNELKLKPGMTANVSIIVASHDDVMKVPNAALRFKPTDKGGAATGPAMASVRNMSKPTETAGGAVQSNQGGVPGQNGEQRGPGAGRRPGGNGQRQPPRGSSEDASTALAENKRPGVEGQDAAGAGVEGRRFAAGRKPGSDGQGAPDQGNGQRRFSPDRGPDSQDTADGSATGERPRFGASRGSGSHGQGSPGDTGRQMSGGQRPSTPAGKRYAVWVLQEGKPKRIPVVVGISDGASTEIVSDELKEGQEVIVESLSKAKKSQNNGANQGPPRFIR